ncbi:MAG: glycerol-3-phosphate O-acyltransferase, partial [Myxococcota bacterium]
FKPLWRMVVHGLRQLFGYYKHRLSATDRLAFGLEQEQAALLFLKHRSIWPWQTSDKPDNTFLLRVLQSQQERLDAAADQGGNARPIRIVPQLLVWTHNPKRYRKSFWHAVFGNPEAPGRFRKVLNFLINRRRAFVQVGRAIELITFLERGGPDESREDQAARLRFEIHQALSLENKVIRGPILKRAKRIREEILANPRVKDAIGELARTTGQSDRAVEKEVSGYIKEIAADYSMTYIEFSSIILTILFSKIYSELVVDHAGLERLREAGRNAPLVLLPCHRSHIDYLVLGYVFYINGLIPPHVASGKNLNFFPVGKILRRSGAFFLRRSFKGNKTYSLAFSEYVRKLIKDGYWVEFFIEGGRSRTGKMLPPKFGMLKIVTDAVKTGAAKDVNLVPIYVGYEHVIEEQSFKRELSGGKKKKENITALINATKLVAKKYGRLYVNFGEAISCRSALDEMGVGPDASEELEQRFLARLGYRVVNGINEVAVVTPTSLASMALLLHSERGISRETLHARIGFLLEMANLKKAVVSRTLENALKLHRTAIAEAREQEASILLPAGRPAGTLALGERSPLAVAKGLAVEKAVDELMSQFVKKKHVSEHEFDDGLVYTLAPEDRINLDFYKNNIVHLLVPEAILATAIQATRGFDQAIDGSSGRRGVVAGTTTLGRVTEAAAFLSRTFKYEFVFDPDKGFATMFGDTLSRFETAGLIVRTPGEDFSKVQIAVTAIGEETMALFHRVLLPWVEAYWLLAKAFERYGDEPITESTLVKHAQVMGSRRFQVGEIACPEAASSVNFRNALNAYEEFGLYSQVRKGRDKLITCAPDADPAARNVFSELAERLAEFE